MKKNSFGYLSSFAAIYVFILKNLLDIALESMNGEKTYKALGRFFFALCSGEVLKLFHIQV